MPITVAIIGAGPAGSRLALAAARAGFRVYLEDVMPANLRSAQEYLQGEGRSGGGMSLPGLDKLTWSAQRDAESASQVEFVSTIEDAVREADLAIDCVPDELESKLEIFCLLDRMAPPRTVIASPITRLSIADLAACTYRADRCIAIAAGMRGLAAEAGREVLLRTTSKTVPEASALVRIFFERIGCRVTMENDPAE